MLALVELLECRMPVLSFKVDTSLLSVLLLLMNPQNRFGFEVESGLIIFVI